ncbi:hypothetical protein DL93DRAFT_2142230 [Clavulina sp. PMI_390]|nr:hypothetical protein DL93DRAFT_2142230 [Clavulina sp. PMI_390]
MSAYWRAHFTFNKYSQIAARALRNSLKEDARLAAEKRGTSELKYQKWTDGKAGESVSSQHLQLCYDFCYSWILILIFFATRLG